MSIIKRSNLPHFLRKYYDRKVAKHIIKSLKEDIESSLISMGFDIKEDTESSLISIGFDINKIQTGRAISLICYFINKRGKS